MDRKNRLDILLIENDPAAARLIKEAFKEAGLSDIVVSVPNGDEAIAYLRREGTNCNYPHPDIIFLDLHLPKKSGFEVLKELKSNRDLRVTPVVVVSGSSDPDEVREAYELHASCFVRKPDNLDDFLRFVSTCYAFWTEAVVLPEKPRAASSH